MNYKQIIEYLKMQNYTDDQIKRAIVFLDNKEYYEVTTQINQEIIKNVEHINTNLNEKVLDTNNQIVKSLDPLVQLEQGYINLNYIDKLSPNVYNSDLLKNVLADAIININSKNLEDRVQNFSSTINGLKEITYVNDMIQNVIPPHKVKDKLYLEVVSNSIKEQFPIVSQNIPENLKPSKETLEFINSISKNPTFKTKEEYVDLQKTLHNIKDDIYSFNGLSNNIIEIDALKKSFKSLDDSNKSKGLYEIHELVQVYAANDLLKSSHEYMHKNLDIKEAITYLNDIKYDDNIVKNPSNINEEEENKMLVAKASTLAYLLTKLNAKEERPQIDLNNVTISQVEELKNNLENRIIIEQEKLEEQRIKNGMIKEPSILSLSLIGLFHEEVFSKYISKEEYEKKLIQKNEEYRLEDEIKYKSTRIDHDLEDIKKQREVLGNSYLSMNSYEKYQEEVLRKMALSDVKRLADKNDYEIEEMKEALSNKDMAQKILGTLLYDEYSTTIESIKNLTNGNTEVNKVLDELISRHEALMKTVEALKSNNNGELRDEDYKIINEELIKSKDVLKNILENENIPEAAKAAIKLEITNIEKAEIINNNRDKNLTKTEEKKVVEDIEQKSIEYKVTKEKLGSIGKLVDTSTATCEYENSLFKRN